jgi:SAM-dependent methyltransferase
MLVAQRRSWRGAGSLRIPAATITLADGARWRPTLILADARHLPLPDASADAVFAAGLIMHLPDTDTGLRQLARITRPGGQLILFHPADRAELAARHGRTLVPGEPLDAAPLRRSARGTDGS